MSRDYKLNKSELARLRKEEKLYGQYLPVLKLKKEQIQLEELRLKKTLLERRDVQAKNFASLKMFVPFFADKEAPPLGDVFKIVLLKTEEKSIAGLKVRAFKELLWAPITIPYFATGSSMMRALPLLKNYLSEEAHLMLLEEEYRALRKELKKATQKVNLFDMVLIPKTKAAIKHIVIALGDEQVASVSRGKIAKSKRLAEELV